MARNVPDLALMLDAMPGLSAHDPLSLPAPAGGYQAAMGRGGAPKRIGFSTDLGLRSIDRDVAVISRKGAERLASLGTKIEEAAPDFAWRDRLFSGATRADDGGRARRTAARASCAHQSRHRLEYRERLRTIGQRDHRRAAHAPPHLSRRGAVLPHLRFF